jgi:hypothetical protein
MYLPSPLCVAHFSHQPWLPLLKQNSTLFFQSWHTYKLVSELPAHTPIKTSLLILLRSLSPCPGQSWASGDHGSLIYIVSPLLPMLSSPCNLGTFPWKENLLGMIWNSTPWNPCLEMMSKLGKSQKTLFSWPFQTQYLALPAIWPMKSLSRMWIWEESQFQEPVTVAEGGRVNCEGGLCDRLGPTVDEHICLPIGSKITK